MKRTLALFVALVAVTAAAAAFVAGPKPPRLRHLPVPAGSAFPVIPGPQAEHAADPKAALQALADVFGAE